LLAVWAPLLFLKAQAGKTIPPQYALDPVGTNRIGEERGPTILAVWAPLFILKAQAGKPSLPDTRWTPWECNEGRVFSDAEPSPPACTPPAPPLHGPSPMLGRGGSTSECYGGVEQWETIRGPPRNGVTPLPPPRAQLTRTTKGGGGERSRPSSL